MELPALLVIAVLVLSHPAGRSPNAVVPLGFWLFHYGYRTVIFPALMRPSQNTFPAVLVLFAVAFNTLNGYNNAQALLELPAVPPPWQSPRFWAGALIFAAGFAIHVHSDAVIRTLRRPGETGYRVPRGGLFRWASSPHYLGEIIQWAGWAVMTWSLAGLAFALFTVCNLAPRALANHRWYRQKFSDYPPDRKVLVPGLW
ncbi:MAG: 3-oxo-5-alpha-steroid 4-dehydrogenase [Xanthomonadales bacterium]|nr:3-oxo-5-alpha-steroid 4-dehydrogenase [Xanthomonadales bacterium]